MTHNNGTKNKIQNGVDINKHKKKLCKYGCINSYQRLIINHRISPHKKSPTRLLNIKPSISVKHFSKFLSKLKEKHDKDLIFKVDEVFDLFCQFDNYSKNITLNNNNLKNYNYILYIFYICWLIFIISFNLTKN